MEFQVVSTEKPESLDRQPQMQDASSKQLPDLVNHQNTILNDNSGQTNSSQERFQHLNLSPDYINHLQRMNVKTKHSVEQSNNIPERTPPQLYGKQNHLNQKNVTNVHENKVAQQVFSSINSIPQSLPNNIQVQNLQKHQVPMLLSNSSTRYGTNIQTFFSGLSSLSGRETNLKLIKPTTKNPQHK